MIRIGTSGWSYKDWAGNFYPADLSANEYLAFYAQQFNTVEIDATFYSIPRKSAVEKWYQSVPSDFKFAAKFPQKVTHESDLTGIDDYVKAFIETMSSLKEKLGPLLLQFPYGFKPEMAENLDTFLGHLPGGFNYVVEIRNRKWLGDKFYEMLGKYGVGLALIDHPWMPKLRVATSKTAYVRFLGDRKIYPEDFSFERNERKDDLQEWKKILRALDEKTDDFYGYFNNHYSGHSPTTARRFIKMIEKK